MDIPSLILAFGGVTWVLVAFVVALSIIVAVHEYGHYIVGRWCGIGAEVFSLGFGPVLFSRTDKRGTKWQIAALPFGGYVKFLGDANAASAGADGEAMEGLDEAARRRTMPGAPLWARAATVAAGPIFNFILSFLVFAVFYLSNGQPADPLRIGSIDPLPASYDLMVDDEILSVGGIPVSTFEEFASADEQIEVSDTVEYRVRRDGRELDVIGPFPSPPIVTGIALESAAQDAGMQPGDFVQAIDGQPISAFREMVDIVQAANGATLALTVWRDGEILNFDLTPKPTDERQPGGGFETTYRIGLQGGSFIDPATEPVGLGKALSRSLGQVWLIIVTSLDGLWNIITGAISTCNLSGPIGIAETAGTMASLGPETFVWFIALLSTAVGLMNLFPIPVLDGGHLVFHAYEAVTGKPPGERAMQYLMIFGLAVIGTLMVFAIGSDLFC